MLSGESDVAVSLPERARRFELTIELNYRANHEERWHRGVTANISRSGVLFSGDEWLEPDTPIEITLGLPARIGSGRPAEVVCRGIVMRSEHDESADGKAVIATKISQYRLVRS